MLGQRLRDLRKLHKRTKQQVAAFLKISNQSYSRIEADLKSPDFDTLISLSKYYSISIYHILNGIEGVLTLCPSHNDFDLKVRNLSTLEKNLFLPYFQLDYPMRQAMVVHLMNAYELNYRSVYEDYSEQSIDHEVECYRKELMATLLGEIS